MQRLMFRTVSQIAINYRGSWLSEGAAGRVEGGDRLPWVPGLRASDPASAGGDDNFDPLTALDWQAHIHGECSSDIASVCQRRGLALHNFPWRENARRAGLERGAIYLVRPDGYIGLADADASAASLEIYLDTRLLGPLHRREWR
jgi:hypothetical protein